MALRIEPKAVKEGMPRQDWDRLKERLERITRDPRGRHPDVKPFEDGYRVRYGDWRAVYVITEGGDVKVIRKPINLVGETTDTVSLRRADFDALLADLEDAEDRAALLEHALAKAKGALPEPLTIEEADRLINGESPVKVWREKRGLTQRALAGHAEVSPSLLAEIESGAKTGSVDTLRKLAHGLKIDLDGLVP